jgi:solute carrier family 13 (sodium-dependent dicarboxylate transporter), member 2/3/5
MTSFKMPPSHWIKLAIAPLLFFIILIINPFGLPLKANQTLGFASLMITWWINGALPMPVVALLPIIFFPLAQIADIKEVTKCYGDSIIFLFMGGFFIAIALEKWNLHKRIALTIIAITGTNGNKIILGFLIATGFLSLWLSNTATTLMMFPIALSIIDVLEKQNQNDNGNKNFALVLMMVLAFASNFAVGTIIGTPPNVAYAAYIQNNFKHNIGFVNWMLVFIPLTIALMAALYLVLVKWLYPNKITNSKAGTLFIKSELKALGAITKPEIRVLIIFVITVFLWITKDIINNYQQVLKLDDTIIALFGAILLFATPSGIKKQEPLLIWSDTTKMAWGILLVFGGGIALANALESAGLISKLGFFIASYSNGNLFLLILAVTTISVFLSEVLSNVAQVIVFAPVVTGIATALQIDPLLLGIPMTLGASCASMLPMGTPPNAIVFSSGYIRMKDMVKAGFVLNIVCIIFITLFCWLLQPYFIQLPK